MIGLKSCIVLVLRWWHLQGWNRNCSGAEIATFCHEPILLSAELSSYQCSGQLYGMHVWMSIKYAYNDVIYKQNMWRHCYFFPFSLVQNGSKYKYKSIVEDRLWKQTDSQDRTLNSGCPEWDKERSREPGVWVISICFFSIIFITMQN